MSRYLANVHYWVEPVSQARTGGRGVELASSRQMLYMKNLLTSFPWQKMVNNQDLILSDNPEDRDILQVLSGWTMISSLAYTPGAGQFNRFVQIGSDRVKAYWFNPRSESVCI